MTLKHPDIIIRGGTIVDGSGARPYAADLAITGDRIARIGDLKGVTAPLEINARGKYVTPGFIDSHSHIDFTFWADPECENMTAQGITTCIVGNCGDSMRHYGDEQALELLQLIHGRVKRFTDRFFGRS